MSSKLPLDVHWAPATHDSPDDCWVLMSVVIGTMPGDALALGARGLAAVSTSLQSRAMSPLLIERLPARENRGHHACAAKVVRSGGVMDACGLWLGFDAASGALIESPSHPPGWRVPHVYSRRRSEVKLLG